MKVKVPSQLYVFLTGFSICALSFGLGEKATFLTSSFGKLFAWVPGDQIDASLFNFILERNWQYLIKGENLLNLNEIFNASIYWPEPNTMSWTDNFFLLTPFYGFFRIFSSPGLAFTLLISLCLTANLMACYHICRHATEKKIYRLIAACISVFSLNILARIGHAQLMPAFAGVLAIDSFLSSISINRKNLNSLITNNKTLVKNIVLINPLSVLNGFIWLLLQIGIVFYQGMFFLIASFCLLSAVLLNKLTVKRIQFRVDFKDSVSKISKLNIFSRISCLILILGIDFLIYKQYYIYSRLHGPRPWGEVAIMIPKFWSLGFNTLSKPGLVSLPAPIQSVDTVSYPIFWEHSMFPGYALIILLILGIWFACKGFISKDQKFNSNWKVFTLGQVCIFMFLISIGFGDAKPLITLWIFLWKLVPGISAIRAVTRIGIPIVLLLSPLLAWTLNELHNRLDRKSMTVALSILFMVYIAGNVTRIQRFETKSFEDKVNTVSSKIEKIVDEKNCKAFYVSSPNTNNWVYDRTFPQLMAMWATIKTGIPTSSGYSGSNPKEGWNHMMNRSQMEFWLAKRGISEEVIQNVCWINGEEIL